jgi:ParB family chromosome partitioning protein
MKRVFKQIPIFLIDDNNYQPRTKFDQQKLKELSDSIVQNGLLQPISVIETKNNRYKLIAGERRLRAFKKLKLLEIPSLINSFDEKKGAILSLIENIQREDLSPIDEARSFQNLIELQSINQSQLAKQIGKSQSTIANKIRLLKLPYQITEQIDQGIMTERHGRALLSFGNEPGLINRVAKKIIEKKLSVNQTEIEIQKIKTSLELGKKADQTKMLNNQNSIKIKLALNTINKALKNPLAMIKATGLKVEVKQNSINSKHQIIIEIEE